MVVFEDEASLSNTATVSYKWGQRGRQPKVRQKQRKRERNTLFGCVEPATGVATTMVALRGNTRSFFQFLLLVTRQYPGRKVIMVLDNVMYHHAKRLRPILERYSSRIALVFLPPYSPDLNPMERIWWYMRKKITHNRYVETMEARIEAFRRLMGNFSEENQLGKDLSKLIVQL